MDNGWIKVHRSIKKKGYYRNSKYIHLWVHLLFKANHESNEWLYKNRIMKVERGQFITSRKSLSQETGINSNTIEVILNYFESEQQIQQQNLFTSRLITILNYDKYQNLQQQDNSKITARQQQDNTNNNYKELKNNISVPKNKKFLSPNLQEVKDYVSEKNYSVDAMKFFNYYEANGWMVGRQKMKKWKSAVSYWERNDFSKKEYDGLTIEDQYKQGTT